MPPPTLKFPPVILRFLITRGTVVAIVRTRFSLSAIMTSTVSFPVYPLIVIDFAFEVVIDDGISAEPITFPSIKIL